MASPASVVIAWRQARSMAGSGLIAPAVSGPATRSK
jgi:hypothetical protein